ncbi:MAG: helix-turn-helix domain-containing protein [Bacilli bacterium]
MEWKEKISNLIKEKGFTRKEFALATGIKFGTISSYCCKNYKSISERNLESMSKVLKVDIEEIRPYLIEKYEPKKVLKCLNQVCPLNKAKKCINDVVIEGRGTCASMHKISSKNGNIPSKRKGVKQ